MISEGWRFGLALMENDGDICCDGNDGDDIVLVMNDASCLMTDDWNDN